jgi:hypothetical protein
MALATRFRRRFTHSLQGVPKLVQKLNVEWLAYAVEDGSFDSPVEFNVTPSGLLCELKVHLQKLDADTP